MTILMAPDTGSVAALLAQNYGVATALTAWSNAILNTSLSPLDPKPSWFDSLQSQLKSVSTRASQWVETDGPSVLSTVPQSFIDFGNLFAAAVSDAEAAMTAIGGASGHKATSDQLTLLSGSISALLAQAQLEQKSAATLQTTVKTFADAIRSSRDSLTSTIAAAEATLTADDSAVTALQSTIASLQNTLGINSDAASQNGNDATTSALSLVGTLFMFGVITLATGGAAAPLMGIAVATISVSYDASKEAANDKTVQQTYAALGTASSQLTAEQAQVAGLRAILGTLESLLDCNSAVTYAADIVVPIWNDLVSRLGFVNEILQQPVVDLTLVSALTSLSAAAAAWTTIVTNATNVQQSTMTMSPPINLSAAAA